MFVLRPSCRLKNHGRRKNGERRGAAMVEMAICFPVLMLIVLGIIEFGRALMVAQLLTSIARESCREAVIDGATNTSVNTEIDNMLEAMVGCDPDAATVDISVTSVTDGTARADVSDAEHRDLIEVEIRVPYDSISYAVGRFLSGKQITGQCSMRKQ